MEDIYYAIIGISLSILYIFYVIIERLLINYYRKKIPLIIHINGIRGKSTTTRLIDAGLRNCGLKVFSKTTGTVPTMINTNNEDVVIKLKVDKNYSVVFIEVDDKGSYFGDDRYIRMYKEVLKG